MDSAKTIICRECGMHFAFTAGEQRFYQSRGWNPPFRCKTCRERKKKRYDESDKYFGIREAMRNSTYTKRDTKGTFVNRSGSSWTHIDEVFFPLVDIVPNMFANCETNMCDEF